MKHLLWALLLILTSCVSSVATRPSSSYIREEGSKTVALVFSQGEQSKVYCTGVWVGSNVILTAAHCVNGVLEHINSTREVPLVPVGLHINYIVQNEVDEVGKVPTGTHLGTCIGIDVVHDVGVIRAEGDGIPTHSYAEVAVQMPAIGEKVTVMGHPNGLYWTYVEGIISSYRVEMPVGDDKLGPYIQVSVPVWYGNSGGGLFDLSGKLVGIASFIAPGPNMAFYIHADTIRDFLKTYKVL